MSLFRENRKITEKLHCVYLFFVSHSASASKARKTSILAIQLQHGVLKHVTFKISNRTSKVRTIKIAHD